MVGDNKIREKFKNIPENIDILLTHDAPYGCSDICYEGRSKGHHAGSFPLREAILEKKRYYDMTGNNVNHPNDFMARVYAQTIIKTILG